MFGLDSKALKFKGVFAELEKSEEQNGHSGHLWNAVDVLQEVLVIRQQGWGMLSQFKGIVSILYAGFLNLFY